MTYTSKQNIQEYFASRMRELQGGKGIKQSNKGENVAKSGKLENGCMDNQVDEGTCFDNVGRGTKMENLANPVEMKSKKRKKRKKSKIEEECLSEEAKTEKMKMNDCSDMIESGLENGVAENEFVDDIYKRNKAKTKKSKKSRKKSLETTGNSVESMAKENVTICCDDDVALSEKVRDKVKMKKGRTGKKNYAENVPNVFENGVDNEPEQQNEERKTFGEEDKVVKQKKGKKRKYESFDGPEMMTNVAEVQEDESNSDGPKRKKNKKKTKRDKKGD